jgi:hypothetical protein
VRLIVAVAETHGDLIEDDIVEHFDAGLRTHKRCENLRVTTAAFDEGGDATPAERATGLPDRLVVRLETAFRMRGMAGMNLVRALRRCHMTLGGGGFAGVRAGANAPSAAG